MGKITTGEKPKFDLVAVSKTKKYKIITAVILVFGALLLIFGLIMRNTLTSAVTPNALTIVDGTLSGLDGVGPTNYTCTISQDEPFLLSTSTPQSRALANPIKFILDDNAQKFVAIYDSTNAYAINTANYQGLFYLHIREDAPEFIAEDTELKIRPTGTLTITCGSKVLQIKLTYHKV